MEYPPTHARVTLSVCEPGFEGFASIGEITLEQYAALPEIENPQPDRPNHFIIDLMSGDEHVDDKWATDGDVEVLLGSPAPALISLGRQRLAQINDEDAEYVRNRFKRSA